jgi:uncharacterized protein (UPF0333 family)
MTKKASLKKKNFKKGQSSVEYILIIAAVVGVIFMFGGKFKEKMGTITEDLFGKVGAGVGNLAK